MTNELFYISFFLLGFRILMTFLGLEDFKRMKNEENVEILYYWVGKGREKNVKVKVMWKEFCHPVLCFPIFLLYIKQV